MEKNTINKLKENLKEGDLALAKSLKFNIVEFHPFFCQYKDLNGHLDFENVKKREIVQPFAICYSKKENLVYNQ